jgi:two-component system cell cycle sensor histidine kinase/response regulator CckA
MQPFEETEKNDSLTGARHSLDDGEAGRFVEAEEILNQLAGVFFPADSVAPVGYYSTEKGEKTGFPPSPTPNLEAQYRTLVEQIQAVVFMAFLDRSIGEAYVSPQIEAMLGYTQSEWLQDPVLWYRQVHPDDKERWSIEASQMFLSGQPLHSVYRVMARDGHVVWFQCDAKMVRRDNGQPWFIHGVGFDITELKEAEEALRKSEAQLRQAQKMESIGTLAGGVAHDFNNLLTVILGNTQLALRGLKTDDPVQRRLVEIEKAGDRGAALTRQMLAFSRRQHLERKVVNLDELIADVMKMLQRIIGEEIEISMHGTRDLWAVFADPGQVEQVVMNLMINARDAIGGAGEIMIETSNVTLDQNDCLDAPYITPGKYVQLRVSDTGSGMDAETRDRIFEPFFTTKEVGKGTGLGLSMVYGIVKQHDGFIRVQSHVGQGTTFKIYLPFDDQGAAESLQEVQPHLRGGAETILIAEDEESLRELARDILEDLGYAVLLADDGVQAVEVFMANRERIALVILDMVMPRLGGFEAYERMRAVGGDVPLIFMTGYSPEMVQNKYMNQNIAFEALHPVLIQKPYSVEVLGHKVREVLDLQRQDFR